MNNFSSILVPLDGSRMALRGLNVALWLTAKLDARLHILSATEQALPAREELGRLGVPEKSWPHIMLHQAPEYPEEAILAAITHYDVKLIVMSAHGQTTEGLPRLRLFPRMLGHVTRAVIEHSTIPVLLLPPSYRETLPWKQALVPVSGEPEADEALTLGVHLANALDLSVHVAHVSDTEAEAGFFGRSRYADAPHHEYPSQLSEFVTRAAPNCTPEECRCIRDVSLTHGDVATELVDLVAHKHIDLLVVGWHGRFMAGRAQIMKHLLQQVTCPVLLVHSAERRPFRLKVGQEIE